MNPYLILGLEENIGDEHEIRRAYKKLALKYHPDKPTGDAEKFNQVAAAYEAIIAGNLPKLSSSTVRVDVSCRNLSEIDPFHLFYQSFRDCTTCEYPIKMKTPENLCFDLKVTPPELLKGQTKLVGVQRQRFCQLCQGRGICPPSSDETIQDEAATQQSIDISCFHCHGSGRQTVVNNPWPIGGRGQRETTISCPLCHGEGIVIPITMEKCPSCLGNRLVPEKALISVNLRQVNFTTLQDQGGGKSNHMSITCVGEGNDSRRAGGERGDLILQVKCEFPRPWYRFQQHLIYFRETPVTLKECVSFPEIGYRFSMISLSPPDTDDQKPWPSISVCIKEVIRPVILCPGSPSSSMMVAVYVIDNYGLPVSDDDDGKGVAHGKLFILLEISFPLTRSDDLSKPSHVSDNNIYSTHDEDVIRARPANENEIIEITELVHVLVLKR